MTKPLVWFARTNDIRRMGPFSSQFDAWKALRGLDGEPVEGACVWPEAAPPGVSGELQRPRTMWELVQLRTDRVNYVRKHYGNHLRLPEFTCDHCSRVAHCTFAYDAYNLDGDCIYDK